MRSLAQPSPTFSIVAIHFPFVAAAGTPPHISILTLMFISVDLVVSVLSHVLTSQVEMLDKIQQKAFYTSSSALLVLRWLVALYWYSVTSHCQSPFLARLSVAAVIRSHFLLPVRFVLAWCHCYFCASGA